MPAFLAIAVSEATRPGPPPWLSMVRPPQNLNRPSTLNACRPQIGAKRTPLDFIQRSVSRLLLTSTSTSSGSVRYSVTRYMSSKNWSSV